MLQWAAVFFVIALAVAVLGFAGGAVGVAKILFFAFLILGALFLIFGRLVPA